MVLSRPTRRRAITVNREPFTMNQKGPWTLFKGNILIIGDMKAKDWIKKLQALPEEAEVNLWLLDTPEDVVNIAKGILAMDAGEGEKMHCGLEMYVQDFNINFLSDDESEQEANIILQPAMRYGMEDEWKEGFDLHYQRKEEPEETDV